MDLTVLLAKNLTERETIRRLKRRAKNQAYYLNNKELIKERSLRNYYLKRDRDEEQSEEIQEAPSEQPIEGTEKYIALIFLVSCIYAGTAVAIWLSNKREQPEPSPPSPRDQGLGVREENSSSFRSENPQAEQWGQG